MPKTDPIQIPLEILDKATSQVSTFSDKFKKTFDSMAVSVTALAIATKKGFEFAEYGASVKQTDESFGLLLTKLGVAPDLINDLDIAAGNTISRMELMSSTATLLAGTSGELGSSLATATPELIEIARAANKLNPSLGTTTHMYESLATGIKRSSPLILDNLGLTIKVGEANQKYADSIGKTVAELTAEETKLALLNETLRAGRVLVDQVGGSTESATDAFNELKASSADLKDELAEGVFRVVGEGVPTFTGLVDAATSILDAENQIKQAFEDGLITWEERNSLINDATWTSYTFADAMDYVGEREQMASIEAHGWAVAQMEVNETIAVGSPLADMYAQSAMDAAAANLANAAATETASSATESYNDHLQAAAGAASTLSTNVFSVTQRLQDNLDFINAGGLALLALVDTAETAMDEGNYEGAANALDAAAQGAVDLDLELGNIDPAEAVERLMDLGLGPEEATAKVAEFEASLFAVTTKRWVVQVDFEVSGTGNLPPGVSVPGTGSGGGTGPSDDFGNIGGPGINSIDSGGSSIIIENINVQDGTDFLNVIKDLQTNSTRNSMSSAAGSAYIQG